MWRLQSILEPAYIMMRVISIKNMELRRKGGGTAATAENRHFPPIFFP